MEESSEIRFERAGNGDVKITVNGVSHIVQKDHWHSAIAQVNYYGEEDSGFYRAANFHSGYPIHETCAMRDKSPTW